MPLTTGIRLGPYEILGPLGAGGMGEVYKARDTRLDRTVAIKVLPAHIATDVELRRRLEREAREISALSHPHICTLHDVGRQDGIDFLVMEYLQGETLASRLTKGALPLEQTLRFGIQIADALDRAHRTGIVHRDLKPGNVMLTKSGTKLLDFGLAQVRPGTVFGTEFSGGPSRATVAEDGALTGEGMILGTLQHMAPEQLEGKPADARTDIFAFGALLYQMATGHEAFRGPSPAAVISAILKDHPPPMVNVQPLTPPALDRVVQTCLAKDPDERWQTAHDVKVQLTWLEKERDTAESQPVLSSKRDALRRWAVPIGVLAVTLGCLTYIASRFGAGESQPLRLVRTVITPPDGMQFRFAGDFAGPPVLAPDGSNLAFVAVDVQGLRRLHVRRLDSLDAVALIGTEGATFPFWAPDSRSIGFFADGMLKRIEATGGAAVAVTSALNPRGASWGSSGTIVFEPDVRSALFAVAASGGQARAVTEVDRPTHTTHRWPHFLPDGKRFLFVAASHASPADENMGIYIGSIDGAKPRLLLRSNANATYASGHLIFIRDHTLLARRFDPDGTALAGEAVPLADDVQVDASTWRAAFDTSQTGLLAYQRSGTSAESGLEWFSQAGQSLSVLERQAEVFGVRLSPAGKALGVSIGGPRSDLWVYELEKGTRRRLTFGPSIVYAPVWSPDATRIAFSSDRLGGAFANMYVKSSNGAGNEELLIKSEITQTPTDWSPDGQFLAYNQYDPRGETRRDIWLLALQNRKPYTFRQTENGESDAQFSPDGKWVAYTLAAGSEDIYVVPFHDPTAAGTGDGGRWQVSTKGGTFARWRQDGKELFYLNPEGYLMAAEVDGSGPSFEVKAVRRLFRVSARPLTINQGFPYDVSPDGQKFIVNTTTPQVSRPIVLVVNWMEATRR